MHPEVSSEIRPKKILVVEDDDDIRESLVELLETEGYLVSSARQGAEALVFLETAPDQDLILLDLMMPVLDGIGFRHEQRKTSAIASIPVILMSADGRVPEKMVLTECDACLRKPVEIEDLLRLIEEWAGRSSTASVMRTLLPVEADATFPVSALSSE